VSIERHFDNQSGQGENIRNLSFIEGHLELIHQQAKPTFVIRLEWQYPKQENIQSAE